MTDRFLVHRLARLIMENRTMMDNPRCDVVDWDAEEKDNPHVEQALAQARACMGEFYDFIREWQKLNGQ